MVETMNKCNNPDPCFFKERGRCSLDFGLPCDYEEKRIGPCGYEYQPFECQKMPCYDECKDSEFKENEDSQGMEETTI